MKAVTCVAIFLACLSSAEAVCGCKAKLAASAKQSAPVTVSKEQEATAVAAESSAPAVITSAGFTGRKARLAAQEEPADKVESTSVVAEEQPIKKDEEARKRWEDLVAVNKFTRFNRQAQQKKTGGKDEDAIAKLEALATRLSASPKATSVKKNSEEEGNQGRKHLENLILRLNAQPSAKDSEKDDLAVDGADCNCRGRKPSTVPRRFGGKQVTSSGKNPKKPAVAASSSQKAPARRPGRVTNID